MNRTAPRLLGYAILLGLLFIGGWAVGVQFPTDTDPTPHRVDHAGDHDADAVGVMRP